VGWNLDSTGLGALDVKVLFAVTLTLIAVTIISSLVPAYRATRINPAEALRME
jgi:ABC-type lipoprotein release transport system permease subunit